ncbi:MAG TPA: hypothetical protein VF761_17170 [Gemmatimonadaceae bacterium]
MTEPVKWEKIANNHGSMYRAEVPGGWLVRYDNDVTAPWFDGQRNASYDTVSTMTFLPDANHQWNAEVIA